MKNCTLSSPGEVSGSLTKVLETFLHERRKVSEGSVERRRRPLPWAGVMLQVVRA